MCVGYTNKSCAKTAEPIEMPCVGLLGGGPDPPGKGVIFFGGGALSDAVVCYTLVVLPAVKRIQTFRIL